MGLEPFPDVSLADARLKAETPHNSSATAPTCRVLPNFVE
jgi:hypothetical protein